LARVREDVKTLVVERSKDAGNRARHSLAENLNRDYGGDADDEPENREQRAQFVAEQHARRFREKLRDLPEEILHRR
jgi:hypothetical protein